MEQKLKDLEKQISDLLEQQAKRNISVIQKVLEEETREVIDDALTRIQNMFTTQCKDIGVDLANFSKVCNHSVKFLDQSASQIAVIVDKSIHGDQKMKIATQLVKTLFGDVPEIIVKQTLQAQYDLIYGVRHLSAIPESELSEQQIQRILPVATPKTRSRLSGLLTKNRRKSNM